MALIPCTSLLRRSWPGCPSLFPIPSLAVKAVAAAVQAEQMELARYFTPLALRLVMSAKKVDRKQLLQMKDLSSAAGVWNEAIFAGQKASSSSIPPMPLWTWRLKDLTAQRAAVSQGGYEKAAGKEGGFREFVKDMDKQRELEQEESIAGVGGSSDKVFERAEEAYKQTPDNPDVLNRYAHCSRRRHPGHAEAGREGVHQGIQGHGRVSISHERR